MLDDDFIEPQLIFVKTMEVRVAAIRTLSKNLPVSVIDSDERARRALFKLFRFADWNSLRHFHAHGGDAGKWLDRKLRLIGSEPHGWAIYRAMKAKYGTG